MNLSGCSSIDDDALKILATGCLGLRNLNLANCQAISEVGIREIAHGCTGIGYLNVSNCKAISRRFLMHLIKDLQFSDPAHTYFGYQPKPDADELRRKAKELQEMEKCAVALQRIIRGTLARGGVKEVRIDEERSNELATQSQATKAAHARTSVQDAPHPQPPL
jgi:hypothetical protein